MKKVLVVLADGFEELEAVAPIDILRRAGADVTVAGVGKTDVVSTHGLLIRCDAVLSETNSEGWDAVVLPGGMPGAKNLHESTDVSNRIIKTYNNGGYVCAICASPAVVLAPLGILNGKKAVCYPEMERGIENVNFCSDKVLNADRIITARGAGCAIEFSLEIVNALYLRDKADSIALQIIY